MVCEVSHTFDIVVKDIKEIANQYNFNVDYVNGVPDEWLMNNPECLFASETKLIAKYCGRRQQRSLKNYQKKYGYDCTFTGRTNFDNNVKAEIYNTKSNKLQAHPIRNFTEKDVWDYFKFMDLRIPIIYKSKFGERTGNAPFYAMGYKNKGCPINICWDAVNELDPERKYYNKFAGVITKEFA